MKTKILLIALLSIFVFTANAQQPAAPVINMPDTRSPCQKSPQLPSFNITLVDSVTVFNTDKIKAGKKTAFVIFGPECPHCRDYFRELFRGIDTFTNIDFYLVTPIRNYAAFRTFYNEFNIGSYKNIKAAGRDLDFFAMDFFGVRQFPFIILYDEQKKLVTGFGPAQSATELHN